MTDIEQYRELLGGKFGAQQIVESSVASSDTKVITDHWTGLVVDNNDPEKLGRCRIRIIGFYEGINDAFLPWACPDIAYMGSMKGGQIIPENNTMVRGYFENGDVQRPVYNAVAFNAYNAESDFTNRKVDYPFKMVLLETEKGDFLTLNRRDGTLLFTHRSGAMFQIDGDGNMIIQTGSKTSSNMEITVNGKVNLNANSDINVKSNGNVDVQCGPQGTITMGANGAKQLVNNVPNCFVCGCPHAVGNIQVKV